VITAFFIKTQNFDYISPTAYFLMDDL